jgi:hypothetical protein
MACQYCHDYNDPDEKGKCTGCGNEICPSCTSRTHPGQCFTCARKSPALYGQAPASKPQGLMTFGKHKGKLLSKVRDAYLVSQKDNSNLPQEYRDLCADELARRMNKREASKAKRNPKPGVLP